MSLSERKNNRLISQFGGQLTTVSFAVVGLILCLPPINDAYAFGKRKGLHLPKLKAKKNAPYHPLPEPPESTDWRHRSPSGHEYTEVLPKETDKIPIDKTLPAPKTKPVPVDAGNPAVTSSVPTTTPVIDSEAEPEATSPIPGFYAVGPASFKLSYQRVNDRSMETTRDILSGKRSFGLDQNRYIESPMDRDTFSAGMGYSKGNSTFMTSVDYTRMRDTDTADGSPDELRSITFGYSHQMSETTSLYGAITHTEYGTANDGKNAVQPEDGNINQFNIGIQHRF
jgi:hypothetical protein